MKRRLSAFPAHPLATLLIALLVLPLTILGAADWGGSVSSTNTVQSVPEDSEEDPFVNAERLVLYLNAPLGARWEFVAQGAATFDSEPQFAADIEKLYFQRSRNFVSDERYAAGEVEQSPGLVEMVSRMGRLTISDPTGLVMSHTVDGADIILSGKRSEILFGAGYTGFINKEFSRVSLSIRDSVDAEDDGVYFGPARLLARGTLSFPELFLRQNVHLGLVVQQDLRDPEDVVEPKAEAAFVDEVGGLLDTQYVILEIGGPFSTPIPLYYTVSYVFNTGRTMGLLEDESAISGKSYQYAPIRAHLAEGRLDAFIPSFFSSSLGLGVLYTSGDKDYTSFTEGNTEDNATMFTAATPAGKGAVFGLQPGNATVTEVSYSLKPLAQSGVTALETLQGEVSMYNFFRTTGEGPVSVTEVDASTDDTYLGTEIDLALRVRPLSDLGIGLTTGYLFRNSAVMFDDANDFDYVIRLNASLSF